MNVSTETHPSVRLLGYRPGRQYLYDAKQPHVHVREILIPCNLHFTSSGYRINSFSHFDFSCTM